MLGFDRRAYHTYNIDIKRRSAAEVMKETRAERILKIVKERTGRISFQQENFAELTVNAIAAEAGILPNNASMELTKLMRQGLLVRVGGRPTYYLSAPELQSRLGRTLGTAEFANLESFQAFLRGKRGRQTVQAEPKVPADRQEAAFETLIGNSGSLSEAIFQAKSACLYPPSGLHTLITGPTGVGKSLFAQCMFEYGKRAGVLKPDAKLITFNCSYYSDNPQFLLAHLFGHTKGAYTGADRERKGLVELADGGMLFLDEIHRLHPEGQEKLFLLLDHGVYQRMGETDHERHATLRLIGATTETIQTCMLSTFLRRIPAHIVLPSLEERPVRERVSLVLYLLWKEARQIRRPIYIRSEVLSALVHYRCIANVGQLENDIRLTCAGVYYRFVDSEEERILIRLSDLCPAVLQGLYISSDVSSRLVDEIIKPDADGTIMVDGTRNWQEWLRSCLILL